MGLSWNEQTHLTPLLLLLLLVYPLPHYSTFLHLTPLLPLYPLPHYPTLPPLRIVAVKCNPNYEVVRVLAMTPGCGFDCASPAEIDQVLACGVDPSRIIYANPCKDVAALEHALNRESLKLLWPWSHFVRHCTITTEGLTTTTTSTHCSCLLPLAAVRSPLTPVNTLMAPCMHASLPGCRTPGRRCSVPAPFYVRVFGYCHSDVIFCATMHDY